MIFVKTIGSEVEEEESESTDSKPLAKLKKVAKKKKSQGEVSVEEKLKTTKVTVFQQV